MKAFFENTADQKLSLKLENLAIGYNRNYSYAAHFHSNMEICLVKNGHFDVVLNSKKYSVNSGDIFIVDHYDVHEYFNDDSENIDNRYLIIPEKFLFSFDQNRKNYRYNSPIISNETLCNDLIDLVDKHIFPNIHNEQITFPAIDLMMALLFKEMKFEEADNKDTDTLLLKKILSLITNHYKEDISLNSISKETGYSTAHISRVFHKYFRNSIRDYVNELRIDYILLQNKKTEKSITTLIYEAGFKNPCTYYRQYARYSVRSREKSVL